MGDKVSLERACRLRGLPASTVRRRRREGRIRVEKRPSGRVRELVDLDEFDEDIAALRCQGLGCDNPVQGAGRHCSRPCLLRKFPPEVTLTCRRCGEPFTVPGHRAGDAQFCGSACAARWHWEHDPAKFQGTSSEWFKTPDGLAQIARSTEHLRARWAEADATLDALRETGDYIDIRQFIELRGPVSGPTVSYYIDRYDLPTARVKVGGVSKVLIARADATKFLRDWSAVADKGQRAQMMDPEQFVHWSRANGRQLEALQRQGLTLDEAEAEIRARAKGHRKVLRYKSAAYGELGGRPRLVTDEEEAEILRRDAGGQSPRAIAKQMRELGFDVNYGRVRRVLEAADKVR